MQPANNFTLFKSIVSLLILSSQNIMHSQVVDSGPSGKQNILPVEGGGIIMEIDSVTPTDALIEKLSGNWEFLETGKGYWIGYTNDMFSIAARGDEAIPKLVEFFKSSQSEKGKTGAIYTLHLIGINRTIVGRFSESFLSPNARAALLDLLPDKGYCYWIMKLLMRDPWQSDIPYLLAILAKESDGEIIWPIISTLNKYKIEGLPVNNEIPDTITNLSIAYKTNNDRLSINKKKFVSPAQEVLGQFAKQYPQQIHVDENLYKEDLGKYSHTEFTRSLSIGDYLKRLQIAQNGPSGYSIMGSKIQYYYKDGALHFITAETARQILNKWWADLPAENKALFKQKK